MVVSAPHNWCASWLEICSTMSNRLRLVEWTGHTPVSRTPVAASPLLLAIAVGILLFFPISFFSRERSCVPLLPDRKRSAHQVAFFSANP